MITLITGTPGTGKTAFVISLLLEKLKKNPDLVIYQHGINAFKLPHEYVFCRNSSCKVCPTIAQGDNPLYADRVQEWASPGSLVVFDECQRIWRPRNSSSPKPLSVEYLETHRHDGFDFYLLTQNPKLLDSDARVQVGLHIHIISKWSGRYQFEWPHVHENVESTGKAVERSYKLPKHIYTLYKSAEVHTEQPKRKPMSFYFLIAAVVASVVLGWFVYSRIMRHVEPSLAVTSSAAVGGTAAAGTPAASPSSSSSLVINNEQDLIRMMTPVVRGVPWSAPIYADMVKPNTFPRVVGCVKTKTKCGCYTQQATEVDMSPEVCLMLVKKRFFNHFAFDNADSLSDSPPDRSSSGDNVGGVHAASFVK